MKRVFLVLCILGFILLISGCQSSAPENAFSGDVQNNPKNEIHNDQVHTTDRENKILKNSIGSIFYAELAEQYNVDLLKQDKLSREERDRKLLPIKVGMIKLGKPLFAANALLNFYLSPGHPQDVNFTTYWPQDILQDLTNSNSPSAAAFIQALEYIKAEDWEKQAKPLATTLSSNTDDIEAFIEDVENAFSLALSGEGGALQEAQHIFEDLSLMWSSTPPVYGVTKTEEVTGSSVVSLDAEADIAISGIWENKGLNDKDKTQIVIDKVTPKGFNFQLFIVECTNTDEGEHIYQGGFDGKAVFETETTAKFKGIRGDAIKEVSGTISFSEGGLQVEFENLAIYQDEYHVKLVSDFKKVSDYTLTDKGLAARATMPFHNRELTLDEKYIFDLMPEDALSLYGEPSSKERGELVKDEFWEKWTYNNIELEFWGLDKENRYYGLRSIIIKDSSISFVRGTKVGDSLEDVITKLPDEKREPVDLYGEMVKPLYGIPIHFKDHGLIKYKAGNPVSVRYVREGTYLVYEIKDNKVVSIKAYSE